MSARYLLRFDDLCPTMDSLRWRRFTPLLRRFGIRPILAIVPANQDPLLRVGPSDPGFWNEMRGLQARGATIGLHGYRHLCRADGRSLVPLHRGSEFAGVSAACQRAWIEGGLRILRGHGLDPRIWVAPRHGFDRTTLHILRSEGLGVLSDGFARRPYREHGMVWIPQQLWGPVEKSSGVWTICVHANTADEDSIHRLEAFLERHTARFTSVECLLADTTPGPRTMVDRLHQAEAILRLRLRRLRKT